MVFLEYLIIIIFLSFLVFHYQPQNLKTLKDRNWLPLGLFSEILTNLHRLHDFLAIYLNRSGGTFMLRGPWFAKMDMLLTTDPLDIHHVLSKNFPNYPKGQNYRKLFDIFGDGIVNIDGRLWEIHRKTIMSLFRHPNFQSVFEAAVWKKVETGLLPVLESISKTDMEIDLQDIFQRFTFDTICKVLLEYDPQSLSLSFPYIRCEKAWVDITEGMLYRHLLPPIFWKLQRLLRMGKEKKLSDAYNAVDHFVDKCLARIQHESGNMESEHVHKSFGLVTSLVTEFKSQSGDFGYPKNFVRDTIVTLMGAGRDTTSTTLSWFFYLVAKNPIVEDKIREEIHTFLERKVDDHKNWNSKEPEILPSGHQVTQNTRIILYYYGMGRMEKIWGKDCMEFKPERWISEKGGIKHEPSNKFVAFGGGPRTCLGKDMSFTQLKIAASTIIYHYHIELVEGHPVIPSASMVLMMKHGLKVRLTKISEENI
ncbi:unnamed protein product [Lactuca saligna]|uniref:Cytochrome P450 n=1 Tax=Lactuca saligna TaxID=75948 RepID=A0AA35UTS5_LACSI|nr:unnamed protein product [Lactuca saligna]